MILKLLKSVIVGTALALSLAACGQTTMYNWSGYDYALLKHYKDATTSEELATSLGNIIEKIERKEGNVPPGLYADYAYALYDSGQEDEALIYFLKEKEAWPESAKFMTNVISRITGTTE